MSIKQSLKIKIKIVLFAIHHRKHEKFYRHVMALNGIANKPVEGEKEWLQKWSFGGGKISPTQYRVFAHYIGPDIDIVPEDVCHDFIEPILNPFRFAGYYADKNVFDRLFPQGFFPMTILRRFGGVYQGGDYRLLTVSDSALYQLLAVSDSALYQLLAVSENRGVVVKPTIDGMSGRNVRMFKNVMGVWRDAKTEEKLSVDLLEREYGDDYIIQEAVNQHEYINQFCPTSANTLRLSLYRSVKDEQPHITGAIMRIGANGSVVDNAHAGGCYVGIHKDGTFCHEVLDQYGVKRTSFNDIDFSQDFQYPCWEKVIKFAKSLSSYVPHHRLLALDIILQKNEMPVLLEFNVLYYSSWLFQYTTGPAWGEYTDEILEYCKNRKSKLEHVLYI